MSSPYASKSLKRSLSDDASTVPSIPSTAETESSILSDEESYPPTTPTPPTGPTPRKKYKRSVSAKST